ncbi:hypothetical protein AHAS_Ahas16G0131600 [Arachis hypogaea]
MQQGLPRPLHLFAVRASDSHNGNHAGLLHKLGLSDAECEAAVVASNVPEAPPIPPKPASLVGTPVVPSLPLNRRPRHNWRMPRAEGSFSGDNNIACEFRQLNLQVRRTLQLGLCRDATGLDGGMDLCKRLLFTLVSVSPTKRNEAYNDNGLVPRSIRLLKDKFPDLDMYDNLSQKIEDVMTAKAIPFPLDGEYTSFLNTG